MKIINKNERGFGAVEAVLVVVVLAVVAGAGYFVYNSHKTKNESVSSATGSNQMPSTPPPALPSPAPQPTPYVNVVQKDESVKQETPEAASKNADEAEILTAVHESCKGADTYVTISYATFAGAPNFKQDGNYAKINANACTPKVKNVSELQGSGSDYYVRKVSTSGVWKVDLHTQMIPQCADLDGLGYPASLVSQCIDKNDKLRAPGQIID